MGHNNQTNCTNPSCSKCMKPKGKIEQLKHGFYGEMKSEAITRTVNKINEIIDFLNTVEAETKFGCYAENPSLNKMARELLQEKPAPEKEEKSYLCKNANHVNIPCDDCKEAPTQPSNKEECDAKKMGFTDCDCDKCEPITVKPAPEKEEKEDEPTKEEMEETQRNWDDMVSGKDY